MTSLLPNLLAGRWQTGHGAGTPLFDPVLGNELVRVDAGRVTSRIAALPWVRHARLERRWPGTVIVSGTTWLDRRS